MSDVPRPEAHLKEIRITSAANDIFKDLRSLLDARGVRRLGRYLLAGKKMVLESVRQHPQGILSVVADLDTDLSPLLNDWRHDETPTILRFASPLFRELDAFGTRFPMLLGNVPSFPDWDPSGTPSGLELLCALGEPSNLGAVIRSAAALGVERIVLLKEATTPFHPKALRAAAGSVFAIDFARGPSIHELPQRDVFALDLHGEGLHDFRWPREARLLVGEEGPGIPSTAEFHRIKIEMRPEVESLNATVAASLALFAYRLQHPLKGKTPRDKISPAKSARS